METIVGNIYDHPTLYDVLFSDSCEREMEFLNAAPQRYGVSGRENLAFFEPACGTGRLVWRLAAGSHEIVGLDLNPTAVGYCNRRLRRHGLPETAICGDMTDFTLKQFGRKKPFDVAFNFVSSFLHLTTETLAIKNLRAVSAALQPKGLYFLGLHLLPHGEAACSSESWSVTRGRLSLRSNLGRIAYDKRRRLETVEFRIEAKTPKRHYEVVDRFPLRSYTAKQFQNLLAAADCFEILETFDFDLRDPVSVDAQTEDVVYVLRKKSRGL